MPIYQYQCRECRQSFSLSRTIRDYSTIEYVACPDCTDQRLTRVFSPPALPSQFQPHYNPSVGAYVTSQADMNSHMARISDETSARTGMPSKLVAADPREVARDFGVTGEGLESTLRTSYNDPKTSNIRATKDSPTRWL
jgi:putative FmdB family regulatory protein